ncbi:hypothetical protein QBC32DRAFT_56076 [Pseudoneurospora amorphoporcata]|uniref:Uncharacterized protein n=1 Tax=Pseudoneurospora amorphoporcata TaxID=241081 RepID=A0AAN6SKN6_9PEZI|nr:hypothetical protein QBC32DRAFT_56076 [Pseudoneurospora amorphoporcata]
MGTSVDTDARRGAETKELGTHTLAQDTPSAFLSLETPSISNFGDELPLQFMFYEPRFQEPEPVMPKIWQDFGHVPVRNFSPHLSPIQSRSLEYSSSQRRSSSTELSSIPADASASYLKLITPSARPSLRLESFPVREVTSISEHEVSVNNLTGRNSNQNPVHPNSTIKSHNPQPSKIGSTTSDLAVELDVPYHLLFSAVNSDISNENPPPKTPTPTTLDKVPPPSPSPSPPSPPLPPPAESPPLALDDAFLSQEVPTKYLAVNAQLRTKMTWLDVLSVAQSVLACEAEPVVTSKVNVQTVGVVWQVYDDEEDPTAADDADGHSLLAKSHVAEAENCNDDDEEVETVRSSFSSFDIRDVNLPLHKEVSRIRSWREKWRGTRRGVVVLGENAF